MGLFGLVACQPSVVTVEVTRTVPEREVVEVTRLVPTVISEEVTRLVTEEVLVEITKSPLGSETRPVQLLFPPVADTAVINKRGAVLADALSTATGQTFAVGILDSEQAVIDLMCAAPLETIGFLSAPGYVLAQEQCDVQVGAVAERDDGLTWQTGMIVTRRDSGLNTLEDLDGKRGAVSDKMSMHNFLYFQALLAEAGVEPAEIVEVPGDSATMLAVFAGDVDFATADFVPPIMPYEERLWQYGEDDPEPSRYLGIAPKRSPIGYVLVNGEPEAGGYRLRDARSRIFDVEPQIYDMTQIITLSAPIPNTTIAFGSAFPLGLARDVVTTLNEFAASEACARSLCSADFYGWAGLQPADDNAYEPIRFIRDTLDLAADEMLTTTHKNKG